MNIEKLGVLFIVSIMALATVGVSYALWSENLYIEGTVTTGSFDVDWSIEDWYDDEIPEKDVSGVEASISDDWNTLFVTIYNAYPCITYTVEFDLHCVGTVPAHFTDWAFDYGNCDPSWITITPLNDEVTTQLHQGEHWYGTITIHLDNDAVQNSIYYFSITTIAYQYNEDGPTPPPENNPPYTPSDPDPFDGATNIEPSSDFVITWDGGDPDAGDLVNYHLHWGIVPDPSFMGTIGSYNHDYSPISFTIEDFITQYETTYYWKIIAEDDKGLTSSGPVWSFTTRPEIPPENSPPYEPTDPTPANNADYEDVYDVYLECTVSDPDGDPMDVSFYWGDGTFIATDSSVPNNGVASIYLPDDIDPDWLSHDTTYTWYAVANDGEFDTPSPTWNFKTCRAWDMNLDRKIDDTDVLIMLDHIVGNGVVDPPGSEPWDINNDGWADPADLDIIMFYFGQEY